jgi:hypothetical protein
MGDREAGFMQHMVRSFVYKQISMVKHEKNSL